MAKLTLTDITSLANETTAMAALNANNEATEAAMENTLSRDGSTPNEMAASIDMDGNRILNLPAPASASEPMRKADIDAILGINNIASLGTLVDEAEGWADEAAASAAAADVSRILAEAAAEASATGTVADGAVSTVKIQDGAVTSPKIVDKAVTNTKLADMATQRVKGRNSASTGNPEDLTLSQILDWVSNTRGSLLFRGNANWQAISPATAGYYLQTNGAGADPTWADPFRGPELLKTQAIINSPVDANGQNNLLPSSATGLSITSQYLDTGGTLDVVAGTGVDGRNGVSSIAGRKASANLTWSGLTDAATNYLYVTVAADGTLTPGSSTLAPIYTYGYAASTTNNQWSFMVQGLYPQLGNGTIATTPTNHRVYVGEAVTSGGNVVSTVSYATWGRYEYTDTSSLPNTAVTLNHNLGTTVGVTVSVQIVCVSTDGSYSVGDVVTPFINDGSSVNAPVVPWISRNQCGFRAVNWRVLNKSTGVSGAITAANWRYRVIVQRTW